MHLEKKYPTNAVSLNTLDVFCLSSVCLSIHHGIYPHILVNCIFPNSADFTADELNSSMGVTTTNTPDAGIGVLKRPVWESLAVLMAAVLLKKILV